MAASSQHALAERFFNAFIRAPMAWLSLVLIATGVFGAFGLRVRPDFAVEYLFPDRSQAKTDYDRYKEIYPFEDARALVFVEAPDLWTPQGLSRVAALERDLAQIQIPGERDAAGGVPLVAAVNDVEGPLSIKDVVDAGDETVRTERLFRRADLPQAEIDRKRAIAQTDPLFQWQLTPPDGRAATIRVTLDKTVARKDLLRNAFLTALREVVKRHESPAQKLTISGMPVIRSEYTEMIAKDQGVLIPIAIVLISFLLFVMFRSWKEVAAAMLTIAASALWTRGAMGAIGYPEQILTSTLPIIVMIVSISDTVHILTHYKDSLAAGDAHDAALVHAMANSAWPCLLTEITIALGFLALYPIDIKLVSQFGVATACGMMLTWAANMTVLPLAIHWLKPRPSAERHTAAERAFAGFVVWISKQVTLRPGRVVAVTAVVLAVAVFFGTKIGMVYYAFDDLRPDSPIKKEIEYAEATFGGCDPLVVFIEPAEGAPADSPMLEPRAVRLMDEIAALLERKFPTEVKNALSAADYVKKAHRIFAGAEAAAKDPYPPTRGLVAQELLFIDDGKILRDYIDFDRRTAAVFVNMPDVGTKRLDQITQALRPELDRLQAESAKAGLPVKLTMTGMFSIGQDIYETLVGGLLQSLGGAILVSLATFSIVLRSWRLGLLALIPNILPLALTFGFMGFSGIQLTPNTVIVFSITLVIADDDTVQFFARFRTIFADMAARGAPDPHKAAALATMRESGLPMFITACAVSLGFISFQFSQFKGLAHFGMLVGVSLFTAIFGDLFLTPILLMKFRPKVTGVEAPPAPGAPTAREPAATP